MAVDKYTCGQKTDIGYSVNMQKNKQEKKELASVNARIFPSTHKKLRAIVYKRKISIATIIQELLNKHE